MSLGYSRRPAAIKWSSVNVSKEYKAETTGNQENEKRKMRSSHYKFK